MAYKVFTNGSPLPASDLNTYLMNQSVMVFADSTARSAALTAPTEGMVTYLEDTGLVYVYNGSSWVDINDNSGAIPKSTVTTAGDLIVADGNASVTRLGIGTTGQVLSSNGTTATWTTPSAGGWTLLSTTTLTGTSVSVTSISQSYKNLLVVLEKVKFSTANGFFTVDFGSTVNYCGIYDDGNISGELFARQGASVIRWPENATRGLLDGNEENRLSIFIDDYTDYYPTFQASSIYRNNFFGLDGSGDFGGGIADSNGINSVTVSGINSSSSAISFTSGTLYIYGGN